MIHFKVAMKIDKLSIIIPACNEENTIQSILTSLLNVELTDNISKEIIIVNDCSTDSTESKINEFIHKHVLGDVKHIENVIKKYSC